MIFVWANKVAPLTILETLHPTGSLMPAHKHIGMVSGWRCIRWTFFSQLNVQGLNSAWDGLSFRLFHVPYQRPYWFCGVISTHFMLWKLWNLLMVPYYRQYLFSWSPKPALGMTVTILSMRFNWKSRRNTVELWITRIRLKLNIIKVWIMPHSHGGLV